MKIRFDKSRAYLSLYLFMFVFMPPILPNINILYLLDIIAVLTIITKYRSEMYAIKSNDIIKSFVKSFGIFSFITILHIVFDWVIVNKLENIEYIVDIYRILGVGILISICSVYVVCYCIKNKISFKELCLCFMYAGIIESLFTLSMLISPSIKAFFNNLFIRNVYGSVENSGLNYWIFDERLYGFANVLFDGFGYGTGIIAGIAIWIMFENNKLTAKSIIFVGALICVTVLNSITGFFIAIIALLLRVVYSLKRKKIKLNSILYMILLIILSGIAILILNEKASAAINRLLANIMSILGKNSDITSYNNLVRSSYWTMPDGLIEKIIGTGHSVYSTKLFTHSDTGYTNMVWMVGILGCIWLYGTFVLPLYYNYKNSKTSFVKGIMIFLIMAFMFFEFKGIGVAINTGMPVLLTLLYMAAIYNNNTYN